MLCAAQISIAQTENDSAEVEKAVVISGNRKLGSSEVTFHQSKIKALNMGVDIPILLQNTPSVVSFSDAGNGVGYTGLRIRGTDASRILVTVNGIPINDAESQSVFWVNMPDILSSASEIQIQRGIGATSTGVPTFGGGIHLTTLPSQKKPWAQVVLSGAYLLPEPDKYVPSAVAHRLTGRTSVGFGTGYLPGGWSMDGRFSVIQSDGAIDRSASQLQSHYLQLSKIVGKHRIRLIQFSGKEKTGQAWNGIPYDSVFQKNVNRVYNSFTYPEQTDQYAQHHLQAIYVYQPKKDWQFTFTGHGTLGKGFYEEYRASEPVSLYQLQIDTSLKITQTDLIRRRWLDNIYVGFISAIQHQTEQAEYTVGVSANQYQGKHFGEVIWARFAGSSEIRHRYYQGNSDKKEGNFFASAGFRLPRKSNLRAELQIRMIDYQLNGMDENWGSLLLYNLHRKYIFVMPRIGYSRAINDRLQWKIFAGLASREPVRSDLILSGTVPLSPEHLLNIEQTLQYQFKKGQCISTFFGMGYRNQLVNDGSINDVGAYNRVNIPQSYRAGWEGQFIYQLHSKWQCEGNLALTVNRAINFTEFIDVITDTTYENKPLKTYAQTPLAFSPGMVSSYMIHFRPNSQWHLLLMGKSVSRQFLDNTGEKDRSLPSFTVWDAKVDWTPKKASGWMVTMQVQNLLNTVYAPNGYTYGSVYNGVRTDNRFVYPMSGTQIWLRVSAEF